MAHGISGRLRPVSAAGQTAEKLARLEEALKHNEPLAIGYLLIGGAGLALGAALPAPG